jgi:hypothetical protein
MSPLDTTVAMDLAAIGNLSGDGLYVNVHSTMFPGGVIRGQFILNSTVNTEDSSWGKVKMLFR